jgi:DNA modification methylase
MTPFVSDTDFTLYVGDVREVLRELPAQSVHCVVTSPPYWGLRDYGTGAWEGGDPDCDHKVREDARVESSTLGGGKATTGHQREGFKDECPRCGARRVDQQLGLEPTPDAYVENMVEVFREVRRVLRRDGTCWLNLGSSYASGDRDGHGTRIGAKQGTNRASAAGLDDTRPPTPRGYKPKDMVPIPWLVAMALQADGWYLRSDIIWSKPNPMPESVTDRPTKAHEYLFLLTRSPRYFYDADAIREPHQPDGRRVTTVEGRDGSIQHRNGERWPERPQTKRAREIAEQAGLTEAHFEAIRAVGTTDVGKAQVTQTGFGNNRPEVQALADEAKAVLGGYYREFLTPSAGRNKRSVWEIATEPYPDAHFATFPQALVEPCVLAGTSERGCCPVCGAPWVRQTEKEATGRFVAGRGGMGEGPSRESHGLGAVNREGFQTGVVYHTVGWSPSCDHYETLYTSRDVNAPPTGPTVPCTVLDPFMGSGTTALVARKHGRRSIGIELNPEYARLAAKRLSQLSLLADAAA